MFRLFSLFCDDDEDVEEDDDDMSSSFEFANDVDEDVEHGNDDELGMLSVRAFFLLSSKIIYSLYIFKKLK